MVGKLLKHEFRATGRIMLPLLGALIVLSGLATLSFRGIESTENSLFSVMMGLVIVVFFLGLFAAAVMAVVLMVQRFYKNLMRDEGYLMLTLPVGVHGLVWSKLIVSTLWILVTGLVATALFIFTISSLDTQNFSYIFIQFPKEFWQALQEGGITADFLAFAAELLLLMILSVLAQCLHFYAAMALGHCFSKDKVLLSVVFYIAISFALQALSVLFSAVLYGGAKSIVLLTTDMGFDAVAPALHSMMLRAAVMQLLEGAILYLLTVLPMKKGLNLA